MFFSTNAWKSFLLVEGKRRFDDDEERASGGRGEEEKEESRKTELSIWE